MDVLKPEVYWIGSRCYRVNPCRGQDDSKNRTYVADPDTVGPLEDNRNFSLPRTDAVRPYREVDEYEDESCTGNGSGELVEDVGIKTNDKTDVVQEDGVYKIECNIPASLFPHIIGPKGTVKKRIESETQARIFVPRQNEKGDVVIRSSTESCVRKAHKRVSQIAANARWKRDVTHFLCLAVNDKGIIDKVKEFKERVLTTCGFNCKGLEDSIFQEPEKLHLTICVMVLLDERERNCAAEALSQLSGEIREITEGQNLKVRLRGLEIMNDDPSQVDVLYIKCESLDKSNALQRVADLVANRFAEKGLAKESRSEKVKLHCTVMNSRYRNESRDTSNARPQQDNNTNRRNTSRESFDARHILQEFGDHDFGTTVFTDMRIATRYTKASDGFYKCYFSLQLGH